MDPSQFDRLVNSSAMEAVQRLANSPAMEAVQRLANSPAMEAVQRLANSPAMEAVQRLANSPAMEAMRHLAEMPPPLTLELFGSERDEGLEAAVRRLERAEDLIAEASEPERAVEELAEDAKTVQEAAPPEAQDGVNTWVSQFALWLTKQILQKALANLVLKPLWDELYPTVLALLLTAPPTQAPDFSTNPRNIEAVTTGLTLPGDWPVGGLPAIVERAGPTAVKRVVELFTEQSRDANARTHDIRRGGYAVPYLVRQSWARTRPDPAGRRRRLHRGAPR